MTPFPVLALELLAPLAGIVGAAIAVPALLLLYFLKLRRQPMRVSSTLLWERAVADLQVNAPFRMLRVSVLLLLQLLALASLLVALARPALLGGPARGGVVILLVDASASMGATDVVDDAGRATSRLEVARDGAREILDRLPSGTPVMVIAFAHEARVLADATPSRAVAGAAIDAVAQIDQPGDLAAALSVVEAFVKRASEGDAAEPPRVVLLSDGGLAAPPGSALAVGGANVELVHCGPPPGAAGPNAGIAALSAKRDYEDPAIVRVFTRIVSTSDRAEPVSIVCELDGATVAAQTLRPEPVAAGGGEAAHTFELDTVEGGMLSVRIVDEDVLAADDRAALRLEPPDRLRILLVRPSAAAASFGAVALAAALEALEPRELRIVEPAADVDPTAFDLVVYDRVRPETLPPVPSISFGATLPIPGLGVVTPDPPLAPTGFTFWRRTHPVMRYVTLGDVRVARPREVLLPVGEASANLVVEELATGDDGPLIVLVERGVLRRVVVAFELDDTTWWRDASFPIFLANAADHLALGALEAAGTAWTTVQAPVLPAPTGGDVVLEAPDGERTTLRPGPGGVLALPTLARTGIYLLELDGPAADAAVRTLPVNLLHAPESLVPSRTEIDIAGRTTVATPLAGATPREIWHWFVLLALVLATLEWLLYTLRMRL